MMWLLFMSIIVNLSTFYLYQESTTKTMSSIDFISIGVFVMTMGKFIKSALSLSRTDLYDH